MKEGTYFNHSSLSDASYFICSEGTWKIFFMQLHDKTTEGSEELIKKISALVMVFYGSNGKSNPISMENKVEHEAEDQITYDVKYYLYFYYLPF